MRRSREACFMPSSWQRRRKPATESDEINVAKHSRGGLGPMQCPRPMTTTQHSNQLLEELVAEEIGIQIDQIAEGLQREGWPVAMVKRFMHVAVERLPE